MNGLGVIAGGWRKIGAKLSTGDRGGYTSALFRMTGDGVYHG